MPKLITAGRQTERLTAAPRVDKPPLAGARCQPDRVRNAALLSGLRILNEVVQMHVRLREVRRVNEKVDTIHLVHLAAAL
jgi:hypothetical protein